MRRRHIEPLGTAAPEVALILVGREGLLPQELARVAGSIGWPHRHVAPDTQPHRRVVHQVTQIRAPDMDVGDQTRVGAGEVIGQEDDGAVINVVAAHRLRPLDVFNGVGVGGWRVGEHDSDRLAAAIAESCSSWSTAQVRVTVSGHGLLLTS